MEKFRDFLKSEGLPGAVQSRGVAVAAHKDKAVLSEQHLALLDLDALYFELEQFKRERNWHNLNITKEGIRRLLEDPTWYTLYLPVAWLNPVCYEDILLQQRVATELLKRYCDRYYNYCKRQYIEPRLELRELTKEDDNIPSDNFYQLIVDGDEEQVIAGIRHIKKNLEGAIPFKEHEQGQRCRLF